MSILHQKVYNKEITEELILEGYDEQECELIKQQIQLTKQIKYANRFVNIEAIIERLEKFNKVRSVVNPEGVLSVYDQQKLFMSKTVQTIDQINVPQFRLYLDFIQEELIKEGNKAIEYNLAAAKHLDFIIDTLVVSIGAFISMNAPIAELVKDYCATRYRGFGASNFDDLDQINANNLNLFGLFEPLFSYDQITIGRDVNIAVNKCYEIILKDAQEQAYLLLNLIKVKDDDYVVQNLNNILNNIITIMKLVIYAGIIRGFDLRGGWEEVWRTNMAKIDPVTGLVRYRKDGKILKPEGWLEPNLEPFVPKYVYTYKKYADTYKR